MRRLFRLRQDVFHLRQQQRQVFGDCLPKCHLGHCVVAMNEMVPDSDDLPPRDLRIGRLELPSQPGRGFPDDLHTLRQRIASSPICRELLPG